MVIRIPDGGIPCPDWAKIEREVKLRDGDVIKLTGYISIFARPAPIRFTHFDIRRRSNFRSIDLQIDELEELINALEDLKRFIEGK